MTFLSRPCPSLLPFKSNRTPPQATPGRFDVFRRVQLSSHHRFIIDSSRRRRLPAGSACSVRDSRSSRVFASTEIPLVALGLREGPPEAVASRFWKRLSHRGTARPRRPPETSFLSLSFDGTPSRFAVRQPRPHKSFCALQLMNPSLHRKLPGGTQRRVQRAPTWLA